MDAAGNESEVFEGGLGGEIEAAVDRRKRLIKSAKLCWGDTGVTLHLAGSEPRGAHLENLELRNLWYGATRGSSTPRDAIGGN